MSHIMATSPETKRPRLMCSSKAGLKQRQIAGHIHVSLSAQLPPQQKLLLSVWRQWSSYLQNPAPLALAATGINRDVTREEIEEAIVGKVTDWLTEEATLPLPRSLVTQQVRVG